MIVSGNWDSASCFKPERELTRSIDIRQLFKTENSTLWLLRIDSQLGVS